MSINSKHTYDLEERTLEYSKSVVRLCKLLHKDQINTILISQVVRSSNSVGANYIEANEALSKKDFLYRMRISRKEAKESVYHLKVILVANSSTERINPIIRKLILEGIELKKILSAIIVKLK